MSIIINTQASNVVLAAAVILEDLNAAKQHKIAGDNYKARHALAGYIRSKALELQQVLAGVEEDLSEAITQAVAGLRAERKQEAIEQREYRERLERERLEQQALFAGEAIAA